MSSHSRHTVRAETTLWPGARDSRQQASVFRVNLSLRSSQLGPAKEPVSWQSLVLGRQ